MRVGEIDIHLKVILDNNLIHRLGKPSVNILQIMTHQFVDSHNSLIFVKIDQAYITQIRQNNKNKLLVQFPNVLELV